MENTTSKRLVKNKLNTIQWKILNHMKVYAVGEDFEVREEKVR